MYVNSYDLLAQSQRRVEQYRSEAKWQSLIKTSQSCYKQSIKVTAKNEKKLSVKQLGKVIAYAKNET